MNACSVRTPFLERLDHAEGERLLAGDLRDSMVHEARLLELHVQAQHRTWGVASGLRLGLSSDHRRVTVGAGAAFECSGAVIQLRSAVEIAAPTEAVPGFGEAAFDLILSRAGVRWVPTARAPSSRELGSSVRLGEDVPLGRLVRSASGVLSGPDYSVRRTVHPFSHPHVGTGVATSLTWSRVAGYSLRTIVRTDEGRFTGVPFYVARLSGLPDLGTIFGPFMSLGWMYRDRFAVRLTFGSTTGQSAQQVLNAVAPQMDAAKIAWLGVEPCSGCSATGPGGLV